MSEHTSVSGTGEVSRLKIGNYFTDGRDPLDQVTYERRTSEIKEMDGTSVFRFEGAEVPAEWSQLATDIVVSKYFRKSGVPGDGTEMSARQVVQRIVDKISSWGLEHSYFDSPLSAAIFRHELAYLLIRQHGAFNSPVWFNVGLDTAYGIKGNAFGNWCWDDATDTVIPTVDAYSRPQASACFIINVPDDLMGIYDAVKTEARLFKMGSGVGWNCSGLRSKHEKLSSGGTSSGVMSFLEVFDRAAGATKSGGATRRAAAMRVMDASHPEIDEFVDWKQREEKKAQALIGAGYSSDFNGDAYHTVSGQHSNNSVSLSDAFMHAVEEDGEWSTREVTTGRTHKTYRARDLFRRIAEAAWSCGDPGLQFSSTINRWNTIKMAGSIRSSNPCGEHFSIDNTACNLFCLNLGRFLRGKNGDMHFDVTAFRRAVDVAVVAQEILVDMSSYPTADIAANAHRYRQIGLGYANLGAVLMRMGLPYDSEEARSFAAAVTAIMTGEAYRMSAMLARATGPYPGYEANKESMREVIVAHTNYIPAQPEHHQALWDEAADAWDEARYLGDLHGYRNCQVSLLMPSGTVGPLMDVDTTGIEPDFMLVKSKKLAGGGSVKIVNQSVDAALLHLGYSDADRAAIVDHVLQHHMVDGAPGLKDEHLAIFDCAGSCGTSERVIAPMGHVLMLAAVQPFVSAGISKTVNVPNSASVDDISAIYMESWRRGLKGVAVYRDGCKASQPLNAATKPEVKAAPEPAPVVKPEAVAPVRRKLPRRRYGFTQEADVGGTRVFIRTGEYPDGKLGEIFIDLYKDGATLRSLVNCFAISISTALQHGIPLETLVDKFVHTKFEPNGIVIGDDNVKMATSLLDYVFRMVGYAYLGREDLVHVKTVPPQRVMVQTTAKVDVVTPVAAPAKQRTSDAPFCGGCGHLTIRSGTCYRCDNCGSTSGCS